MADNPNSLIERRIRKLQAFHALWNDPDLADVVQNILDTVPKPAPAAESQAPFSFKKARRMYRKRGGSLVSQTLKGLREYGEKATAKDVADFMRSNGYRFKAKNANVSVSKALRLLADTGKISSARGEHAKAAIYYWTTDQVEQQTANQVPVQEITH